MKATTCPVCWEDLPQLAIVVDVGVRVCSARCALAYSEFFDGIDDNVHDAYDGDVSFARDNPFWRGDDSA